MLQRIDVMLSINYFSVILISSIVDIILMLKIGDVMLTFSNFDVIFMPNVVGNIWWYQLLMLMIADAILTPNIGAIILKLKILLMLRW
jgi:hypothetical protein